MTLDKREWLETNGLGGYAMSTVAGLHTRRYHGLLVAATKPPVGRSVLLSKLEETLILGGRRIDLSTNRFPGTIHPEGFRYLTDFRLEPFPTWTWEVQGLVLERELFMVHGESTTCVTWRLVRRPKSPKGMKEPVTLEVRPLVAFRDFHSLAHENEAMNRSVAIEPGCVKMKPWEGLPELSLAHDGEAQPANDWYRFFELEEERARGFDFTEDLWHPVTLSFSLDGTSPREATVIASTSGRASPDVHLLRRNELSRRETLTAKAGSDPFGRALARAADQFLVRRGELTTVIAGYPWFADWGRDTMIALPGLTLTTGRPDLARDILLAFARHVDQGMLPNRFPDAGEEPEYNTVDATLWYFEAVRQYVGATDDLAFVKESLWGVLNGILSWHERGTRYGIRLDADGLLASGAEGQQLTWMDARVDGRVITPRRGKPVEIQALWYNALRVMEDLAKRLNEPLTASRYGGMASRAKRSFGSLFWNEAAGCLYDVVSDDGKDASLRPNQLFALSLSHVMVTGERARSVLAAVDRELLTPYGLRTLSPRDPGYRGRYEGGPAERDAAYHQGTVWPWLLGPYVSAYLKVHGRGARSLAAVRKILSPLRDFVLGPGLGQVPEIFEGDPPHRPRGCIAQAWSVSELLRVSASGRD